MYPWITILPFFSENDAHFSNKESIVDYRRVQGWYKEVIGYNLMIDHVPLLSTHVMPKVTHTNTTQFNARLRIKVKKQ